MLTDVIYGRGNDLKSEVDLRMKWRKLGKICDANSLGLSWCKTNVMCPMPYANGNKLRVFLGLCDEENRSRIGYIDVDGNNPTTIVKISEKPVLDFGQRGRFDESGVLPASLLEDDGKLYFYYSGFRKPQTVPYEIFGGLAVSEDGGDTFNRLHETPILDRCDGEVFMRAPIEAVKLNGKYKIWYGGGSEWFDRGDKMAPKYGLKFLESDTRDRFLGVSKHALDMTEDEYGLAMPQIWEENGILRMIYSIRSLSQGYRMGYAESTDGIFFHRKDEEMEIDVSDEGFDSEMVCYGRMAEFAGKKYLFYCGNHYGRGGIGCAVLEE